MEDQTPRRRPPLKVIVALVAIALSAGSATAWFTWQSIISTAPNAEFPELEIEGDPVPEGFEAPDSGQITVPSPPDQTDIAAEPNQRQETIYWLSAQGQEVALAPSTVNLPEGETPTEILNLAFADLMTGPAEGNDQAATSIPEQTELLDLMVESDGVHVNLSEEFTTGGGSASMIGRLAQVVYTATTLDPGVSVWISVEGEPLTVLGGEGLLVNQPITRSDLEADFGVAAPEG